MTGRSRRYFELERLGHRDLEGVFLRGVAPDLDRLIDWEFRGTNCPDWARLLGIKKFIKGFFRGDGAVCGYNTPVVQNGLDAPWLARPSDDRPRRFGFYRVEPVDPTARDNAYLHSALLDYGRGGNRWFDPVTGLRDYLVQVDPDDPDLYLGKAYYRAGPIAVPTSFFLLERHRPAAARS